VLAELRSSAVPQGFGRTLRRDSWWWEVLPVVVGLGAFAVYATLRAFEGAYYQWGPYLSPFYSPLIDAQHRWVPKLISPALIILIFPLGFRVTCYYYRKAYYRAFFLDPPACAVSERRHRHYSGETRFPFLWQNIHRYFLYVAVVFLVFLWSDVVRAFWWDGHFGIGVGTLVLLVNIILLTIYLFSCHSLRHLIGGRLDCFSCSAFNQTRHSGWRGLSWLNAHHMLYAWLSLFWVGFTDFYVRMVASGAFKDFRIL
jgi:hypothetical protein